MRAHVSFGAPISSTLKIHLSSFKLYIVADILIRCSKWFFHKWLIHVSLSNSDFLCGVTTNKCQFQLINIQISVYSI